MNRSRCVVIYDVKDPCLERNVESINACSPGSIAEDNSVLLQNVIVTYPETVSKAEKLVNNINQDVLDMQACFLDFFHMKLKEKPRVFSVIQKISDQKLISNFSTENECFVIHHEKKLSLFENEMSGKIKELGIEKNFRKFVVSSTAKFIVFIGQGLVIKYGTDLELFYELVGDFEDAVFGEKDMYLAVHEKKTSSVWKVKGMKKIFETSKTEIVLDECAGRFFVKDQNRFFTFEGLVVENAKYEIESISVCKEKMAILTEGNIKNVIFIHKNKTLQKTQPNTLKISFVWSESFLYVHKKVYGNKELDFLECYGNDKILMYNSNDEIADFKVSDNYVVILDHKSNLIFLQRKRTLVEICRIKKVGKILLSMNRSGRIVAIYNNEADTIEFYGEGDFLSSHKHTYCTELKWSKSGLFMASLSSGTSFAGLVQMFTSNGRLLWKKNFNMVANFQWCSYSEIDERIKKEVQKNYDTLVNELSTDYLEYAADEENSEHLKESWLDFLRKKKMLIYAK